MSDEAQLRVLTFDPEQPDNLFTLPLDNMIQCDSTMLCRCAGCELDRLRAVKRGVRPSAPIPFKRKRAA